MLEIGKYGSVRGVDALCMAEYCDTPQSKEGRNWEYKVCLSNRAIVHLLDFFDDSKTLRNHNSLQDINLWSLYAKKGYGTLNPGTI